jgi:hypothetical protein
VDRFGKSRCPTTQMLDHSRRLMGISMKCKVQFNHASDKYYLIRWSEFLKVVDHNDLACRNSKEIEFCFHEAWFYTDNDHMKFIAPAFLLNDGVARFINGRHRAVLLSKYLDLIPMALTSNDSESLHLLDNIVEREISRFEWFEFPDLPIKNMS